MAKTRRSASDRPALTVLPPDAAPPRSDASPRLLGLLITDVLSARRVEPPVPAETARKPSRKRASER